MLRFLGWCLTMVCIYLAIFFITYGSRCSSCQRLQPHCQTGASISVTKSFKNFVNGIQLEDEIG
jgi:hypothetical protein